MKRIFLFLASVAVFASCVKENTLAPELQDGQVRISAVAADSKALLEELNVVWEETDAIALLLNGETKAEFAAESVNGANADFVGLLGVAYEDLETAYAVYPATAVDDEYCNITHTLPLDQTEGVASGMLLASAVLDVEDLKDAQSTATFNSALTLLQVVVPAGVKSVELTASNYELVGKAKFEFNADGTLVKEYAYDDASKTVTLSSDEELEAKTYPVLVYPGQVGDFSLKMVQTDDFVYEKTLSGLEFAASEARMINLGRIFNVTPVYTVSPAGGNVEFSVQTSLEYTVEVTSEGNWLTYVETKAVRNETVVLTATQNTTGAERTATVTVKDADGTVLSTFEVVQKAIVTELYGTFLATGTPQYGSPTTGDLIIAESDDYSQGTYKVTILGTTLYADYDSETRVLKLYDGSRTREIKVAADFSRFDATNLSIGYSSYVSFVAIKPLGEAVLTDAEQALVGTYNETWSHPTVSAGVNGMKITVSDEATYGQLKVKFLVSNEGSAFNAYANLEDGVLKVKLGNLKHNKFGQVWDPSYVMELQVGSDGKLTMSQWTDEYGKALTNYVATKVTEQEGGDVGGGNSALAKFEGGYNESYDFYGPMTASGLTISVVGDKLLLEDMFGAWSSYYGTYKAELSQDGKTLSIVEEVAPVEFASLMGCTFSVTESNGKVTLTANSPFGDLTGYVATQK